MPKAEGANTRSYKVAGFRFTIPSPKVAEKNPDRVGTVHGDFYSMENGKVSAEALSFHSLDIDRAMALNPLTVIDAANGTLTLPSGERGRRADPGIDADAVSALLASVREAAAQS